MQPEFREYAAQVIENSQTMAAQFVSLGYNLVTGGTENNIIVIDFQ